MGARIGMSSSRRSSRGGPRGGVEHPRSSRSATGSTHLAPVARMTDWQRYLQPEKVEEALAALDSAGGRGRLVAGGTDLLLDIQQGRHPPVDVLVDVARIGEMRGVRVEGESIWIGAAVPHAEIIAHPVLQARATALTEASGLIGGPQVRVVATLGGNVAHALPAGDGTIALLALDAPAEPASIGRPGGAASR